VRSAGLLVVIGRGQQPLGDLEDGIDGVIAAASIEEVALVIVDEDQVLPVGIDIK
jgi:hypothetical protein